MSYVRKSGPANHLRFRGRHKFEHWYRDNQVYFITARCRGGEDAFAAEKAKAIFWDRFEHYAPAYGFTPFVTSLLSNHYHTLGYLRCGDNLPTLMQRFHGSVAKLVNDLLPTRLKPFWCGETQRQGYFDGCIRSERQCRRAYGYTLRQGQRHGLVRDHRDYEHTRVGVKLEPAVRRAIELDAFLTGVPYKRYERRRPRGG